MLLLLSGFYFLRVSGGTALIRTKRRDDWRELADDDDVAVAYALTLT